HYSKMKSRDALLFEAVQSEALIQPGLITLGSQTRQRWQSIANSYRELGMRSSAQIPDGLIYSTGSTWPAGWWLVLLGLVLPISASVLIWLIYKRASSRLWLGPTKPKLSAIVAGLFVCLSIPVLMFILIYNYYRNSEAINATLREEVAKTRQASIENVE